MPVVVSNYSPIAAQAASCLFVLIAKHSIKGGFTLSTSPRIDISVSGGIIAKV